jgi:death-on-curing protein
MKKEPVWIRDDVVLALHERQLAEHGGAEGIRDKGLWESALNAPKHRFHYEQEGIVDLATTYAFSLAMNHPFTDGNKRTAYVCMRLFLKLNGMDLSADKEEKVQIMLDLAAGKKDRDELIHWLRQNVHGND